MTSKKTGAEPAGEVQVIKKKPRGKNIGETLSPIVEPGDNAKFLQVNIELFNMKKIDKRDVEQVQARLDEYFRLYAVNDMKPTVAGMAIALGWSRQQLWAVTHDAPLGGRGNYSTLPQDVTDTIKKAYFLLENMWESYMSSGKINPVSGIFLGKNNFGYQDKTEYVVTPNVQQDNYDPDSIRQRYLIDSADSGSDSDSDGE